MPSAQLPNLSRPVCPLSAVDLLAVAFEALSEQEQTEALALLQEHHLRRVAGEKNESARYIADLGRVAERFGPDPSADEYRLARRELAEEGIEIADISRIIRHFGSWRTAKEGLVLSENTTINLIEARFRSRRLKRVWRYTEETMRETVARAVADLGRVPQVSEFDWWRKREIELAEAQGDYSFQLPASRSYRRRWGGWTHALRYFGYSQDAIDGRLGRR